MEKALPPCLKIKGIIESDDGGDTWYVSRIDYFSGANDERGKKEFLPVPEDWQPCQLVLKRLGKAAEKK